MQRQSVSSTPCPAAFAVANVAFKPGVSSEPAHLLIIGDNEPESASLGAQLRQSGYDITEISGWEPALNRLRQTHFDLIISPLRLAQARQRELLQAAQEIYPDIAFLLIAGVTDVALLRDCLRIALCDYVLQPADAFDVNMRVQRILERRRMHLEITDHKNELEKRLAVKARRIRNMFQNSLRALNQALEAKDEATQYHSARVADLSTALAARLCFGDAEFASLLRVASLFHDIGKIGVPESILNKPDRLTPDEMAIVQRHPVIGEAILQPLVQEPRVLEMVRHHHERIDGQGYPDSLEGAAIPLGARIIAVADAFDAMTSIRAYRAALPVNKALENLISGAGTQWDARVVEALIAMDDEGELEALCSIELPDLDICQSEGAGASIAPIRTAPLPYSRVRRPIIYTAGDMDEAGLERLRFKVGGLVGQGENDFIIDMRQIGCLTAEAVQFIYLLHLRTKEARGKVALRDVPDHAMNAFRESRLATSLIFESAPLRQPRRVTPSERRKRAAEMMRDNAPNPAAGDKAGDGSG